MSEASTRSPGQLLSDLMHFWRQKYRKRATGGWWALAGFSFQTSLFLLHFFRGLERGAAEPAQLAEMEQISDIVCPRHGRLTLIQVKRTLKKPSLVSAIEEAYLITTLCKQKTPALIKRLRFQIACRNKPAALSIGDVSMSDLGVDVNRASWEVMLGQFDSKDPILVKPDTLDHLNVYLWNVGIREPKALVERCMGCMLAAFNTPSQAELHDLSRKLAELFISAERRRGWTPIGQVLTARDFVPDPRSAEHTDVLTGHAPKLEHLRKGYFRNRPSIFGTLSQQFTDWLSVLNRSRALASEKTPVFWVGGRSGEGKSILLLQLIAQFQGSVESAPLVHLQSGNDLPELLEAAPERDVLSDSQFGRIFAAVDDLFDLRDREDWGEKVQNACSLRTPPVAIITCGPTEQREQFASLMSDQFEVSYFDVPQLDLGECREFLVWYEARTGQSRDMSQLTTENALLVQVMFEMAQGVRMPEFAKRFRRRLSRLDLFPGVRTIAAVNALYMDAPLDLLPSDSSRDALQRLCKKDQLHFRVTPEILGVGVDGVRLAHPHLAWLLFVEWVQPPTTLVKALARELERALGILDREPSVVGAGNLLFQLSASAHLSDSTEEITPPLRVDRKELIRELYQLYVSEHNGHPTQRTLPRWLDLEYKIPTLQLVPDPAECAVAELTDNVHGALLHASVAGWVWLISEFRSKDDGERLRSAVKHFLHHFPESPGIGRTLTRILARSHGHQMAE